MRTLKVFDLKFTALLFVQILVLLSIWFALYQLSAAWYIQQSTKDMVAALYKNAREVPRRSLGSRLDVDSPHDGLPRAKALPNLHANARELEDFHPHLEGLPPDSAAVARGNLRAVAAAPRGGGQERRKMAPRPPVVLPQQTVVTTRPNRETIQHATAVYRDLQAWHRSRNVCSTTDVYLHVLLRTSFGDMTIYVHDPDTDNGVSNTIMRKGSWQPEIVNVLLKHFDEDASWDFLDIGAHVGPYSLVAAKLNRRVFAVEPFTPSVQRLCRSASKNKLQHRIHIVHNALSDSRRSVTLRVDPRDKGKVAIGNSSTIGQQTEPVFAVLLDDLLEVFQMQSLIVKLDASGHEASVLAGGTQFFQQVNVPYLLMAWVNVREGPDVGTVLQWMHDHSFVPLHPLEKERELDIQKIKEWPDKVLWKKIPTTVQAVKSFWEKFGF